MTIITISKIELKEDVVYFTKRKLLYKYLGDIVIKYIKKENPAEQSSWSVDTSRMNYLIKDTTWIKDNKGIKMCDKTIKPLLNYILEVGREYICSEDPDNVNLPDKMIYGEAMESIRNGSLSMEINKYIAPYFKLNLI